MVFAYQYTTWLSFQTENILRGSVPYFLCHGTITSYTHKKLWGVIVYIINGRVTRKKIDDISHRSYFVVYASTAGFILHLKSDQHFVIHRYHHVWFDEYNYPLSI